MTAVQEGADHRANLRRRVVFLAGAAALAAADLAVKQAAVRGLAEPVDLGPLELRVGYNPGVAFSLGDTLPAAVVLAATVAITAAVTAYAWRSVPTLGSWTYAGLTLVVAGALGNVIDRSADGVVTDYLHTGWFPTFNLADVMITGGAIAILVGVLRESAESEDTSDQAR